MKKILLYTFRTFPWMGELSKLNIELFVFGKLKADMPNFLEIVENIKSDIIVGIAKTPNRVSQFESRAVNIFNEIKKVSHDSNECYALDFPNGGFESIEVNNSYTDSFCNWTMYKIAESTKSKQQFIHIAEKDFGDLIEYLNILDKGFPHRVTHRGSPSEDFGRSSKAPRVILEKIGMTVRGNTILGSRSGRE